MSDNPAEKHEAPSEADLAAQIAIDFPIPATPRPAERQPIPVRMLNEYIYCPRLAYLEWVQQEWADSPDTVHGRWVHRRVDRRQGSLPEPSDIEEEDRLHTSSLQLGSKRLGLSARIDLLEVEGGKVSPVDYKRGKRPHVPNNAYDPERVQLCAQGLILQDAGYECDEGFLYFAGSRERVRVVFDDELRQLTLQAIASLEDTVEAGQIPPPLEDSPKCPRCSLVPICLPDETNYLRHSTETVRPLAVAKTRALPVYVQAYQGKVAKKGERLAISVKDEIVQEVRLKDVSQLAVLGNVYITTPTIHELMRQQIPISWHSYNGYFLGHTIGTGHGNVELRTAQYRGSFDEQVCLKLAKGWIAAKIRNSRTLLRRNTRVKDEAHERAQTDLGRLVEQASRARDISSLLGIEGAAAALYFNRFSSMFTRTDDAQPKFDFSKRDRRPPTDPVNAMLSFGYAMLSRTFTMALSAAGFDPYRGFMHQPRYGRPALALDMMEPFRSLVVDSAVLTAVNNGEVNENDFVVTPLGTSLTDSARKSFIATFERRLSQEITHPIFGYRVEYRRLLEVQARLLGRFLLGEINDFPNFTTR